MRVRVLRLHKKASLPQYMTEGSAGCDISACLESPVEIQPGDRVAIPTGLAVEIPSGFELQIRPRSGLAFKNGLTVVNAPGTIDSDFRGEVKVLLVHLGQAPVTIEHGQRVAQGILNRFERAEWTEADHLNESDRGSGGFGSTGV